MADEIRMPTTWNRDRHLQAAEQLLTTAVHHLGQGNFPLLETGLVRELAQLVRDYRREMNAQPIVPDYPPIPQELTVKY